MTSGSSRKRGADALRKARQVRAELALHDLGALALVHELDRVLQADDVQVLGAVQVIDHGRERGGLAGAGGARHEDHALVMIAELLDDLRQVELLELRDIAGNESEGGADARLLAKHVDAETAGVLGYVGHVDVAPAAEALLLGGGEDFADVGLELGGAEVAELDRHEIAMQAEHRRHADGEVHVGAALGQAELQEGIYACHGRFVPSRGAHDGVAHLVHGIVALHLVDLHGLADDGRQRRRDVRVDFLAGFALALHVLVHHGHVVALGIRRHARRASRT